MERVLLEGLKHTVSLAAGEGSICTKEEMEKNHPAGGIPFSIEKIFEISQQEIFCQDLQKKPLLRKMLLGAGSNDEDDRRPKRKGIMGRKSCDDGENEIFVNVHMFNGKTITMKTHPTADIQDVKKRIQEKEGIPLFQQRIFFSGKEMGNGQTLDACLVPGAPNINLFLRLRHGSPAFIDLSFIERKFNHNFTHILEDRKKFYRGGREYIRPLGCRRYGLKVLDKYDNNNWLGDSGEYKGSDGEWPVAYHGTLKANSVDILRNGFDVNKGKRFRFGRGVYCTPCPQTAMKYALSYDVDGKKYKIVFQVRVDPDQLQVVKEKDAMLGEYWLVPDGAYMRAYGICIYPVD